MHIEMHNTRMKLKEKRTELKKTCAKMLADENSYSQEVTQTNTLRRTLIRFKRTNQY